MTPEKIAILIVIYVSAIAVAGILLFEDGGI